MDGYYFSVTLDNDRTLCVAPLTERRAALSGQELQDTSGYFLFEHRASDDNSEVHILAKVLSEESVFTLKDMFKMT